VPIRSLKELNDKLTIGEKFLTASFDNQKGGDLVMMKSTNAVSAVLLTNNHPLFTYFMT